MSSRSDSRLHERRAAVRLGILTVFLGCLAGSSAVAGACPGSSSSPVHEVMPSIRLLLPIPSALKAANPRAEALRGLGVPCERGTISADGQTFVLTGQGSDGAGVRRAVSNGAAGATGKAARAALLVPFKKAEVAASASGGAAQKADPVTYYALTTVTGTRVKVWRLYDGVPADDQLQGAMSDSLWEVGRPLLSFNLAFKGPKSGPETLKDWD